MRTTNAQTPMLQDDYMYFLIKDREYCTRPIRGYRGYFVSTCGQVISLVSSNRTRLRKLDWSSPQVLTGSDNGNGYLQVRLYSDEGYSKFHLVHRLVALTHLQKPNSHLGIQQLQVNHINKDRKDNHARNLNWVTAQENADWNAVIAQVQKETVNDATL